MAQEIAGIYGVTHDLKGQPLTRLARALKVGFGYAKGPAIHVYIGRDGKWYVEVGVAGAKKLQSCETRQAAEKLYRELRATAPVRQYPGKFPFFTFSRVGDKADFYPAFDAIEQHGPVPQQVPIVFLDNNPLQQSMQWWTAAELKCQGDGRNALRRISAAQTDAERKAAETAAANGEDWFPITEGCSARGCPLATGDRAVCKPHSRLNFQLAASPAIGTTCTFDSTGFRTAVQLFSALEQIRTITGRGDPSMGTVAGIRVNLKLLAYKTSHKGVPAVQFGVTLYMAATDAVRLMQEIRSADEEFRQVAMIEAATKQLEAGGMPHEEAVAAAGGRVSEQTEAQLLASEFYSEAIDIEGTEVPEEEWEDGEPVQQKTDIRRKSEQAAASSAGAPAAGEEAWPETQRGGTASRIPTASEMWPEGKKPTGRK